jgi:predicted molibdopterin-dependent oxidoreductase YjgC
VLVPWSDPVHVGDGSLSRKFHWSEVTSPGPMLMVSKDLADDMGLRDGDTVTIASAAGETPLTVKRTDKLSGKTLGASIHFPTVRKLFPWKLDERTGEICLAPIAVRLGREKS